MPKLIAKHLFFENAHRTASTSLYQIVLTIVNNPITVGLNLCVTLKKMPAQAEHIFDTFEYF